MGAQCLPSRTDLIELRERADLAPDALSDAECLALLVRRGADRAALVWAEHLLAAFGSLPELLAATPSALARVAPPAVARDVRLLHDLQRRALAAPLKDREVLASWTAVADYLRAVLSGLRREQFHVLFLDRRLRLISDEVMGHGTVDHAPVYPREVMRRALELDASGLLMAHNHPSGDPTPSSADVEMTQAVAAAGRALRVAVHDHFIVGGREVVSLRRLGLL